MPKMRHPGNCLQSPRSTESAIRFVLCVARYAACNASRRPSPSNRSAGRVPQYNPLTRRFRRSIPALASRSPSIRRNIRRRPHLVRLESLQMLRFPYSVPMCGKKLVRRARQKCNPALHVDQPVRRKVHRIDKHQRPGACANFVISATGLIVPTIFDAYPTARASSLR